MPATSLPTHIAATPPATVITSAYLPNRVELTCSLIQNGRLLEFLGSDEVVLPLKVVARAPSMPPICIIHGRDDHAVPVKGSQLFFEIMKSSHPNVPVMLNIQPGDHGFDGEATLDLDWLQGDLDWLQGDLDWLQGDLDWLQGDLEFLTRYWLQELRIIHRDSS